MAELSVARLLSADSADPTMALFQMVIGSIQIAFLAAFWHSWRLYFRKLARLPELRRYESKPAGDPS